MRMLVEHPAPTKLEPVSRRTALAVSATAALALWAATSKTKVSALASGSVFTPVTPTRVYRRTDPAVNAGTTLTIPRPAVVPAGATAVVLSVTAAQASGSGFLTVFPAATTMPVVSSLNYTTGGTVANMVTVPLSASGVAVFSSATARLSVDVLGYYSPAPVSPAAGRYVAVPPYRAMDTRNTGAVFSANETRSVSVAASVPSGATAVVVNLTATRNTGAGEFAVLPDTVTTFPPTTSTLCVSGPGETRAAQAVVAISLARNIKVFAGVRSDLIVDIVGYYTGSGSPGSTGLFTPVTPFRLLDTRTAANPLGSGKMTWPGWTVPVGDGTGLLPSTGVVAAAVNITIVKPKTTGYLTAYAAGLGRPGTSSVNAPVAGAVVANHALVGLSSRGIEVFTSPSTHVLVDVFGYFSGVTPLATYPKITNYVPDVQWPATLAYSKTSMNHQVQPDTTDADLTLGPGFWIGSSVPGQPGLMIIFGHRTSHGGPFRNLHLAQIGDTISFRSSDRIATYRVVGARGNAAAPFKVVPDYALDTEFASDSLTGLLLIACSKPDGTPTSTANRIIVRAELVSMTQL